MDQLSQEQPLARYFNEIMFITYFKYSEAMQFLFITCDIIAPTSQP